MRSEELFAGQFSFADRPTSVPGDLRLSWRIPVLLLMLHYSRQKRASLIKLHVLNDAVRSFARVQELRRILRNELPLAFWQPRVEPAFARAIDFANGDGLVTWVNTTNGAGLSLAGTASPLIFRISEMPELLVEEKQVLSEFCGAITEGLAKNLLAAARTA